MLPDLLKNLGENKIQLSSRAFCGYVILAVLVSQLITFIIGGCQ